MISSMSKKIGFIGTGVMGYPMAEHLLHGGHELHVFNRTREKADGLEQKGAQWCSSPGELAPRVDVVFTMLGYPSDVESTYLGVDGLLARAKPGTLLVDFTTSTPELAEKIHEQGHQRGTETVDAPVSGGDLGARAATLSIMVGGDPHTVDRLMPMLQLLGQNIVHQGGPGSGQYCKMANQIAVAGTMLGTCEAMAYAQNSGLDPLKVLESIQGGAAGSWSLQKLAPKILKGDDDPGFCVKHFIKDLRIALESAERLGLDLPATGLAKKLYERVCEMGYGEKGTQALAHAYPTP